MLNKQSQEVQSTQKCFQNMFEICIRVKSNEEEKFKRPPKNVLLVDDPDSIENVPEKRKTIKTINSYTFLY